MNKKLKTAFERIKKIIEDNDLGGFFAPYTVETDDGGKGVQGHAENYIAFSPSFSLMRETKKGIRISTKGKKLTDEQKVDLTSKTSNYVELMTEIAGRTYLAFESVSDAIAKKVKPVHTDTKFKPRG